MGGLLLILGGVAGILVGVWGLGYLIVGILKRRRALIRSGILIASLAFVLLAGSLGYAALKIHARLSTLTWGGTVEYVIDSFLDFWTTVETVSMQQVLTGLSQQPGSAFPEITNFQGLRADFPGFTNYYLRYTASKDAVLAWVAASPASESAEIKSDSSCNPALWESSGLKERFAPRAVVAEKMPFWNPNEIAAQEYYTCLRFPWLHTLIFDPRSHLVYHVIEEIRE
jgi:hypothetical protein